MKSWVYYLVAAALLLLTVPMYVYVFWHAGPGPASASALPAARTVVVPVLDVSRPEPRVWPVRLMPGEKCFAGLVFQVTKASSVQLFDAAGRPVTCSEVAG